MFKKDDIRLGIGLGLIGPFFGLIIYYFLSFYPHNVTFVEFLGYLRSYKTLLTVVSSLSLLANAALFTVFINIQKDRTAKGIFAATLVYGIAVLLVKIIK